MKMNDLEPMRIDVAQARSWVKGQLTGGSLLSILVERDLDAYSSAALIAPGVSPSRPLVLDDYSRGVSQAVTDRALDRWLASMFGDRETLVVVERDLSRRGDRHLKGDFAFIGQHVVSWEPMNSQGGLPPARFIRSNSSGYPSVAFLLEQAHDGSDLQPLTDVGEDRVQQLLSRIACIVTSLFDNEGFVALFR